MMVAKKVLIGTNNAHKVSEIRKILSDYEFLTPNELGIALEIDETGDTFAKNAILKARAFCSASGLVTIADDSGLAVDALNGEPGVHSHRYCPLPGADDADRRAWLIRNRQGAPRPWTARFQSAAAVCFPDSDEVQVVFGSVEGEVIPEERGTGGFGYDSIFYLPDRGLTMAELSGEQKNEISHRGRAMEKIRPILRAYYKE